MKKWLITSTVLLLLAPVALLAKEEREKCKAEASDCLRQMAQNLKKKGWIGIKFDYDEQTEKVMLSKVFDDSPAQRAGLQVGDVLLEMDGVAYTTENEETLKKTYYEMKPGETLTYIVEREGEKKEIVIELGRIPDHLIAQWVGKHMLQDHAVVEEEEVAEKP